MSSAFFQVSGIDADKAASMVFVWCRAGKQDDYALVGSGHVVRADGALPPGIQVGQFSVVFSLLSSYSADEIVVTDDRNDKQFLPNVSVINCSALSSHSAGHISDSAHYAVM